MPSRRKLRALELRTLSQQVVCLGAASRSSNENTSGSLLISQYRFSPGARAENAAAQAPFS